VQLLPLLLLNQKAVEAESMRGLMCSENLVFGLEFHSI